MSGFKPYPSYKDSGGEWLGEVPEHWAVHPLKRAIERIESGTSVNAADVPAEPGSFGVLKTSCVYTGRFDWTENKTVDDEDLSRVSCPVRRNTLIVSRMNTPDLVGATGLVTEAPYGIFLPDRLWQIYFESNHSPEFLFYFTKSREYREQVKMACSGTSASMQNLGQDDFKCLLFAEPSKSEQTQIARFLDHETARIDALIEEQQRLIELLKEKRQAVISHAVTKGLDPTVMTKDSGVEWLGEVPAHWVMAPIKRYCDVRDGTHATPEYVMPSDCSFPLVTSKDISAEGLSFIEASHISAEDHFEISKRSEVVRGDILMPMIGTIGGSVIVDVDEQFSIKNIALFKVGNYASKWLSYVLDSHVAAVQFGLNKSGGVQSFVSLSTLRNLMFPIPSKDDQENIAAFLDLNLSKLDQLICAAKNTVGFMLERRSALISAAVTGKIDVRGWQPPARAQAPEIELEEVI